MDLIDSLYLERENVRQSLEVYKKQIEMVSKKKSIAIFIEGTRIYEDTFGEFKHAALKIAYHSYLPILPIVIFGSSGLVDSNKTNVKKGKTVYIKSLDIIQPKTFLDRDSKLFCDELKEKMQKQYDKMNENYNNKKPIFIEQK
jgi:1-acyl-sn-glycerol-3-phosphate acyltransferase